MKKEKTCTQESTKKKAYQRPQVLYREEMAVQCNVCSGGPFKSQPGSCTVFSS